MANLLDNMGGGEFEATWGGDKTHGPNNLKTDEILLF